MMCSISDAKGVSLPEEKLTGQLNVRIWDSQTSVMLGCRATNKASNAKWQFAMVAFGISLVVWRGVYAQEIRRL